MRLGVSTIALSRVVSNTCSASCSAWWNFCIKPDSFHHCCKRRPQLIHGYKFDIRQWVRHTDFVPSASHSFSGAGLGDTRSQPAIRGPWEERKQTQIPIVTSKAFCKKDMELFGIFGVAQVLVTDWNPLTVYIWCEPQSFETLKMKINFRCFVSSKLDASWCSCSFLIVGHQSCLIWATLRNQPYLRFAGQKYDETLSDRSEWGSSWKCSGTSGSIKRWNGDKHQPSTTR